MNDLTTLQNTSEALHNIEKRFYNIPFENSNFQNTAFVVAAQITPERAYRSIGLRLHSKLRALQENYFAERKSEIRIGELQELIESPETSKWDKMRHELEIEQILTGRPYVEKLKNDAIQEIGCLYAHLEKLPEYTREEFEAAEANHFEQRLTRATNGISGPSESLINIRDDVSALINYETEVQLLSGYLTPSKMETLRLCMHNQLILPKKET